MQHTLVSYVNGHGQTIQTKLIGTHRDHDGITWYAVWETIRDEPIWLHEESVIEVIDESAT